MNEWRESLEGVGFPAIVHILGALGKTGRLRVWLGSWSADVHLREGQVVSARFGQETGLAALEAIIASLNRGEFSFSDDVVGEEQNVRIDQDYLDDILERMDLEWEQSAFEITTPSMVPRPIEPLSLSSLPPEVVLDRNALETLMALDGRRTVADIAYARGVARSFRDLAKLTALGLIALEPPSSPAPPLIRTVRPNAVVKSPTLETLLGEEPEERLVVPAEPVCPRLGFADDPDNRFSRPTRLHRCFAEASPATVTTEEQVQFCLATSHQSCPRFSVGQTRAPSPPQALSAPPATALESGRGRRGGLSLGGIFRGPRSLTPGEVNASDSSRAPSATTPMGGAMLRRRRPTGDLATLVYFVNCLLDEPLMESVAPSIDLRSWVQATHRRLGVVHFELPVSHNRLATVPTRLAVADRESVLEVITSLIRHICAEAESTLGSEASLAAYQAVYGAIFSDRPADEASLGLARRLPFPQAVLA